MLTRLRVQNFKTFADLDIELAQNVVFIGPNNSGKTTALQALALWQSGLRAWHGRNADIAEPAAISRRQLTHTPVRDVPMLWHEGEVFDSHLVVRQTRAITIIVDGQTDSSAWRCGLEFRYANSESLVCRPVAHSFASASAESTAAKACLAFLPPMSGIVADEPELQPGRIDVLIGEGQTAQVLRNLCLRQFERNPKGWASIVDSCAALFGVVLGDPRRDRVRGGVDLSYRERRHELDISSAGRGIQQTLLLLVHMHGNPGATLLLDEPDAHLEILRQREIYNLLTETARGTGSQIIAASHSEVILNEAASRDVVIAFVGKPHRVNTHVAQVRKSLSEIGYDQYYQAQLRPGVLYLEGATDLSILKAFAILLHHSAAEVLQNPFVKYVGNQPPRALDHFFGLREAKPDLKGFAVFDRLEAGLRTDYPIAAHSWRRREIENYFSSPEILLRFAATQGDGEDQQQRAIGAMNTAINDVEVALRLLERNAWGEDARASSETLPAVFRAYYKHLGLVNEMNKADYHMLVQYLLPTEIDAEIVIVLDRIHAILGATP